MLRFQFSLDDFGKKKKKKLPEETETIQMNFALVKIALGVRLEDADSLNL